MLFFREVVLAAPVKILLSSGVYLRIPAGPFLPVFAPEGRGQTVKAALV
jgi:hypothetical protein